MTHPYEKFRRHKVIIRSLDDKSYPEIAESTGISSWFRVEPYDFYHNGLEVILNIQQVIMNREGQWRPISYEESFDESIFHRVKVWVIGRIPFQFIRAYDLQGDDYYREPHLYCAFANDGEPYEAIRYATVGDDNTYDWPLDNNLRFPAPGEHANPR